MIKAIDTYFETLKQTIDNLDRKSIEALIELLLKTRENGNNIYIMGNGGSAATASHFTCDFNKGLSYKRDIRFKMICLNDNIATMLAYSNDLGYENVFVEQLKNFLKKDDVVIGISGSGNSKNILKAVEYANGLGANTVGITGFDGGKLKDMVNVSIHADINNMQVAEDVHMMICHMLFSVLSPILKMENKETSTQIREKYKKVK